MPWPRRGYLRGIDAVATTRQHRPRNGTADVAYWDNWALTNAGAAMARVTRLRNHPFNFTHIKPPFHGHPNKERVYERKWFLGRDGCALCGNLSTS